MKWLPHSSHCGSVSSVMPLLARPVVQSQKRPQHPSDPKTDVALPLSPPANVERTQYYSSTNSRFEAAAVAALMVWTLVTRDAKANAPHAVGRSPRNRPRLLGDRIGQRKAFVCYPRYFERSEELVSNSLMVGARTR